MADGNFGNVTATGNIVAGGYISATGNVTAARLLFTSPTTANLSVGNIALFNNLNMVGSLSAGGNITAARIIGNLVTANQPNITNIGTLSSLTVSGNIVTGNISVTGAIYGNIEYENSISVTGNVSANALLANALVFKTPTTANLSVGNLALFNSLNITGAISTSGNITSARFIGNLVTANQPNITNVGTLTRVTVTGNTIAGNILTAGIISATGNATLGNVVTTGLVSANAVFANAFTFNSPTTANISAGNLALYRNLNMTGSISAAGNIRANYIFGNGAYLSGVSSGANTGNITFDGTTLSGPAGSVNNYSIYIKPSADYTNALQILPTGDYDIHLFEAAGNAITLGAYGESQVSVNGPNSANANITVQSNGNTWKFGANGTLELPVVAGAFGLIQTDNAYPELLAYGSSGGMGIHGGPELDWMDSDDPANTFSNVNTLRNTLYINGSGLYVGINENGNSGHFSGSLFLDSINGNLTIPGNLNAASGSPVPSINGFNSINAVSFSAFGNISSNSLAATGVVYAGTDGQLTTSNSMKFADVGGEMTLTVDYFSTSTVFTNDILGSGNSINVSAQYGNSVLFDTTGGISATGNITASTANLYAVTMSQSIAWPGASEIYEDSGLIIDGALGVLITSPNLTQITSNVSTWNFYANSIMTAPGDISTSGNIISGNVSTATITLTNGAVIKDTAGNAVAFGQNAGQTDQGINAVAIGALAGEFTQGGNAVAVGFGSGYNSQGVNTVAIGQRAGEGGQGDYAVAIGYFAGQTNQANNSIILNATNSALNQTTANTFTVKPVRGDSTGNLVADGFLAVYYNPTTGEFAYASS